MKSDEVLYILIFLFNNDDMKIIGIFFCKKNIRELGLMK